MQTMRAPAIRTITILLPPSTLLFTFFISLLSSPRLATATQTIIHQSIGPTSPISSQSNLSSPETQYTHYLDRRCCICNCTFESENAFWEHGRTATSHAWCEPCKRPFVHENAKADHLRDSAYHREQAQAQARAYTCNACNSKPGFRTKAERTAHWAAVHHHCPVCFTTQASVEAPKAHRREVHFQCLVCEVKCSDLRGLITHEGETPPRKMAKMRCACGHNYKKMSELVYHLEKGTCNSGTDETEVDKTALLPTKFREYTTTDPDGGWMYRCPVCSWQFYKMSEMFRHVENGPRCFPCMTGSGALGGVAVLCP